MADVGYGRRRQAEIYLAGLRGRKPHVPQSAAALERAAERATTLLGWRLRDLDSLWRVSRAYPGSVWQNVRSTRPRQAAMTFVDAFTRPSLDSDDVALVREATRLPPLLKGVLGPGYMPLASPTTCPSGSANRAIVTWGSSVTGKTVLPPSCSALSSTACGSSAPT